jgi:hypothetical protein
MVAGILTDALEGTGGQGWSAQLSGRGGFVGAEPCTLCFEWIESNGRAKVIPSALKTVRTAQRLIWSGVSKPVGVPVQTKTELSMRNCFQVVYFLHGKRDHSGSIVSK